MKKITIALFSLLLIAGMVFTASAFTSSELTRGASIDVTDDTNGIISLTPGETDAVTINDDGALTIDTSTEDAQLNVESLFTYGDETDVTNNHAFSVVNTEAENRQLTFSYEDVVDSQGQTDAVEFAVYDSANEEVTTATEETAGQFTASSGETYYVVLNVDTNGLNDDADLSGEFTIRT